MIKFKKHLTKEGLEEIRLIKAGMNTGSASAEKLVDVFTLFNL